MGKINELSYNQLRERVTKLEEEQEGARNLDLRMTDQLNFGVYIVKLEDKGGNKNLRLIYANPVSEKISGFKKDEIISKTLGAVFPEFMENGISELLNRTIEDNKVSDSKEVQFSSKTAGLKVLSVKTFPLGDNYFGISFENITKRKSIKKALKESENRFRSILSNSNSIICLKDLEGRYMLVNKQFEILFGQNNLEVIGKSDYEIFPEEFAEKIALSDREVISNQITINIEEVLPVRKELFTFLSSKFPIYDNEKNIYAICCISADITDRKNAEEELNKIFRMSADLICITTLDGNFLKVNPAFENILGYSEEEFLKKPLFDFLHPDDLKKTVDTVKDKLEKKDNLIKLENRYRCKNGTYKWFSWISQAIPEKNVAFSIARDITTQKFYEQELIIAKERAEESDRLKSAFLANMSHEIRTPMNGILGFTKMLDNENLTVEKRNQYVSFIHSSADQLLSIINDIIDISKIEAGQLKLNLGDADLNVLMDRLYTQYESERITRNKDNLKLECIKSLSNDKAVILIDEIRIRQVLSNMLSNALKFSEKGTVTFGYELKNNDKLLFFVKDTGIGISKSKQKIIFERFRQEDESFTRKYGGAGLGLAITKSIIEQMDGEIWVDSDKNMGAAFYIQLPYKQSPTVMKKGEIVDSEIEYNWRGNTILVVEDDFMGSEYLKEIIEPTQAKILLAENGIDAVDLCKNMPEIKLILMDLRLPKMDGYSATAEIRKIRPKIPIIAQTANAMPEDKVRAQNAGSNEFITKPINRVLLLNTINNYLQQGV